MPRASALRIGVGIACRRSPSCAQQSPVPTQLAADFPSRFKSFEAFYRAVQTACNDTMHVRICARHATGAAIERCIGLEEALRAAAERTVGNVLVTSPMTVEPWQPVAHARQL